MTIVTRRIAYLAATALFVVAAPVLVLYAQGYRINVRNGRVFRTGAVEVRSYPRTAQIFVDGRNIGEVSGSRHLTLIPGTYTILVSADGYQPWEQHVSVASRQVIPLTVVLLPASPPSWNFSFPAITAWSLSPDQGLLAVASQTPDDASLTILDVRSHTVSSRILLPPSVRDVTTIAWSATMKHVAFLDQRGVLSVVGLVDSSLHQLPVPSDTRFQAILWETRGDSYLYAISDGSLWSIDLLAGVAMVVASPHIVDVKTVGDEIWVLRKQASESELQRLDPTQPNRVTEQYLLPASALEIFDITAQYAIVGSNQQVTYFRRASLGSVTIPVAPKASVVPRADGQSILIRSEAEVRLLQTDTGESQLLTRNSGLTDAAWHPSLHAAIILDDDYLQLVGVEGNPLQGSLGPYRDGQRLASYAKGLVLANPTTISLIGLE